VSRADDILVRIAASVRARLAATPAAPDLEAQALAIAAQGASRRSLRAALARPGVRVIAECKRRSPSAGWLRQEVDPVALACAYEAGGAAAISVVTEPEFFAGDTAWLAQVRAAVALPVLQKDFVLAPRQLYEAVLLGADAVLLIARLLDDGELAALLGLAARLGLEPLVEAHDGDELVRVLALPAPLVGVNARDLRRFTVNLDAAAALAARVPDDRIAVLESGVAGAADVRRALRLGVRRFLVGECLVRARDPRAALAELVACA
jgi:indole-3-glycerol phosphate synthase